MDNGDDIKIGFEIHQQLDTRKLFCKCKSLLSDDPEKGDKILRKLRIAKSELGEIDRAAAEQFEKGLEFVYIANPENACLVELDEEPPHDVNAHAIAIAIEVAMLLHADIVDEIHFMRKIVVDGSNTTGFQRTAIIALGGYIETEQGKVRIPTLCLEEEAARIIKKEGKKIYYNLDRLGIPLIEISTAPDIKDPFQAREVALKIGEILRATKKVKRGIGSIRQDVNISVKNGARVEIKGVQELNDIPKIIENEIKRQKKLIELRSILKERVKNLNKEQKGIYEIEQDLSNVKIFKGKKVFTFYLKNFSGIFKEKLNDAKTFGNEIAGYVKNKTGIRGFIHSDEELEKYGISSSIIEHIREKLKLAENDLIILFAGSMKDAEKCYDAIIERIKILAESVPEETRRVIDGYFTEYMRPLPGAARMYPETDVVPFVVDEDLLKKIRENLPEKFEDAIERVKRQYSISHELASQIVREDKLEIFEFLCRTNASPSIIARTLLSTIKEIEKEGFKAERITTSELEKIFHALSKGKIAKEAIPEVLKSISKGKSFEEAMKESEKLTEKEIEEIIEKILEEKKDFIKEKGERAFSPLMGILMKDLRGKADGKVISSVLKKKLEERIKGGP